MSYFHLKLFEGRLSIRQREIERDLKTFKTSSKEPSLSSTVNNREAVDIYGVKTIRDKLYYNLGTIQQSKNIYDYKKY